MWFKAFIVLRIPISIACLLGYGYVQRIGADTPGIDCFAAAINTALFVFLTVVSIKLVRFRPGALSWAGWLLALELVGAVLLSNAADIAAGRVEPLAVVVVAVVVGLAWTLPNALVFYFQRGKFTAQEIKKPGL